MRNRPKEMDSSAEWSLTTRWVSSKYYVEIIMHSVHKSLLDNICLNQDSVSSFLQMDMNSCSSLR
jgi:hypothetical protein